MKTKHVEEAIELINKHVEKFPQSQNKEYLNNLVRTHIRLLLFQLSEFTKIKFNDWCNILYILNIKEANVTKKIINTFPDLRGDYNSFINIYIQELFCELAKEKQKNRIEKFTFLLVSLIE